MCDNKYMDEKKAYREMLKHILQNVRYLAQQGLLLQGSSNDKESNFIQLLHLYNTDKSVEAWLSKKTNKYTSHNIQDELLGEMARKILIGIADNVDFLVLWQMYAQIVQIKNSLPPICAG